MKVNETIRGQNHKRFKDLDQWHKKIEHNSYYLVHDHKQQSSQNLVKENMLRGLEWFIEELKPLSQK